MILRFSGEGTSPATAAARVTTALRRATWRGRAAKAACTLALELMATWFILRAEGDTGGGPGAVQMVR